MEIAEIREQTGLTQRGFSELTHIPLKTIRNWEQGRSNPPVYLNEMLIENLVAKGYVITENRADTIESIKSIVNPIAKAHGVKRVMLFGSRARGDFNGKSDYDFFVSRGEIETLFQLGSLYEDLKDALKSKVDIVLDDSYDIDYIKKDVEKEGILLYES